MSNNKTFTRLLALGLSALMLSCLWGCRNKTPDPTQPGQTDPTGTEQTDPTSGLTDPDATTPLVPLDPTSPSDTTEPTQGIVLAPTDEIDLGNDLYITDIGEYTGIYMEDGVDDFVTGIMMVVLNNRSQQDLQLAQFDMTYEGFTASFEVTNIPAGESVVLLEKNRHAYVEQTHTDLTVNHRAFFQEPMGLRQDRVKLTEGEGTITVENLTDAPMGGIYIYYKNSAADIYYGGITYRTKLTDGLQPGESKTLIAAHFYPGASTVVDVQILDAEH